MTRHDTKLPQRRQFLRSVGGIAAGSLGVSLTCAGELSKNEIPPLPQNTNPRAISGDLVEPDWQEQLTITVGPENADLVGSTDQVLQAAVDYVTRLGGGTVHILPGTYRLRNSIFLTSKVRILGSGTDSVLVKEPSASSELVLDGDHWDQEVTLADPQGFEVGDGVRLFNKDPYTKGFNIVQRTIIAASGNRFKLDRRLEKVFHLGETSPQIATNFALFQCNDAADITIENVALDGNKANNEAIDGGKYDDGCIRLERCNRVAMRELTLRDFNCDGIVWGISHDVIVENCHLQDGVRLAIHSGSGSQRSIVRGNYVQGSQQGIYFCWGAQHGLYEKNVIEDCSYGVTFGHRDTDNLVRDNDIRRSSIAGILFREQPQAFLPNRNRIERNRILDSGGEQGVAIDISSETESITLLENELRETRKPRSRIGIRIGSETRDIRCIENQIEGFATPILDLRKT